MRVLLVSDRGRNPGGTERYLAELAAALRADGDEVRMLAGVPSGGLTAPSAGTIGSMAPPDVSVADPRGPARAVTQVVNPAAILAMRKELSAFRPDAVHAAMVLSHLSPAVLHPLGALPSTLLATDHRFACPVGTKLLPGGGQCRRPAGRACLESGCVGTARAARDGLRQAVLRRTLGGVNRVLACSRHMVGELGGVGIAASQLALPVDPPTPSPRRAPGREPAFVYAGRLAEVKGIDDLLDAFAAVVERFPSARLTVCGDGPDRDEVRRRASRPGLAGRVSMQPQMALDWTRSLASATALVAPSRFREPLGLSVIEAILRGVPVVATREGGHAESVEEGVSGLLVGNGDVRRLTEAMLAMCGPQPPVPAIVPDEARARLAERHDPGAHRAALRSIWTSGAVPAA